MSLYIGPCKGIPEGDWQVCWYLFLLCVLQSGIHSILLLCIIPVRIDCNTGQRESNCCSCFTEWWVEVTSCGSNLAFWILACLCVMCIGAWEPYTLTLLKFGVECSMVCTNASQLQLRSETDKGVDEYKMHITDCRCICCWEMEGRVHTCSCGGRFASHRDGSCCCSFKQAGCSDRLVAGCSYKFWNLVLQSPVLLWFILHRFNSI